MLWAKATCVLRFHLQPPYIQVLQLGGGGTAHVQPRNNSTYCWQ